MKDDKPKYLVFRVYTEKERPDPRERSRFYGWAGDKSVIKAFLTQRSKDKYVVRKVYNEELAEYYSETDPDQKTMIDFVNLKSASTGETVKFFITEYELQETEKKIQKLFRDLSVIIERPGCGFPAFEIYQNLKDKYMEALDFIGFNPPERQDIYDMAVYRGCMTEEDPVDWEIDQAYRCREGRDNSIPGLSMMTKFSSKVVYSVESFIKVLIDDM